MIALLEVVALRGSVSLADFETLLGGVCQPGGAERSKSPRNLLCSCNQGHLGEDANASEGLGRRLERRRSEAIR